MFRASDMLEDQLRLKVRGRFQEMPHQFKSEQLYHVQSHQLEARPARVCDRSLLKQFPKPFQNRVQDANDGFGNLPFTPPLPTPKPTKRLGQLKRDFSTSAGSRPQSRDIVVHPCEVTEDSCDSPILRFTPTSQPIIPLVPVIITTNSTPPWSEEPAAPMKRADRISSSSLQVSSSYTTSGTDRTTDSRLSFVTRERLLSLRRDIKRRLSHVKDQVNRPPTPDDEAEESAPATTARDEGGAGKQPVKMMSVIDGLGQTAEEVEVKTFKSVLARCKKSMKFPTYFDGNSKLYLMWLAVVASAFLYNAYGIPLRAAYPYQTDANLYIWFIFDYLTDAIYILDIIFFKPREVFVKKGITITDPKQMKRRYLLSGRFKIDLLSLLPTDFLYVIPILRFNSLVRFPRILKFPSYRDFFKRVDSVAKSPTLLRITKTLSYTIYLIHCNSCVYYAFSAWEGVGSNGWVYSGEGVAYLRCFYFATKLAISIGNNPQPRNVLEHIYAIVSWMMGVFVFAMLLGQVQDIVAIASKSKDEFRRSMDETLKYCLKMRIPSKLREKARMWYVHTWEEQKTLHETFYLQRLPKKLQTDVAISVHMETLNKVQLFQQCDPALLRDLVLKLKPVLFLPGDFVCRKGEVGKEMYIVNKGMVQVVGGPNGDTVFVTLKEGSVFGEISLLAISGANRRTADVRSKGFSVLFILSKADLHEAIQDYPDAQKALKKKARQLLARSKARDDKKEEVKAQDSIETMCKVAAAGLPKIIKTVYEAVPQLNLSSIVDDEPRSMYAPPKLKHLY